MTGSISPESETVETPHNGHPVHRAAAVLEEALHSPALDPQFAGPFEGPSVPLATSPLGAGESAPAGESAHDGEGAHAIALPAASPIAFFELGQDLGDARAQCQPRVIEPVDVSALDASALHDEEEEDMRNYAAPPQLQGLVKAFQHNQRRTNFIVAASVGAALALTLCLLLLLGATTSDAPSPDPGNAAVQQDVSSLSPFAQRRAA